MNKQLGLKNGPTSEPMTYGQEPFISKDYARAEGDKLWSKIWQHACRVEEIPKVGDFCTYDIHNDSIIIVRSAPDQIKAFHNVCSHRNRRLTEGCGNTKQFFCKYHAWRYDLNGKCIHVLDREDWGGALKPERIDLPEVKADTWGGWVWINMDLKSGSLREYLEPVASMLDPFEIGKMRYRWRKWGIFNCNWKTAQEAFLEAYHVEGTHPQLMAAADFFLWSEPDGLHSHQSFRARTPDQDIAANKTILRTGRGDPRESTAKLQREIWETVNARTTQTLVDAAQRLPSELPEGTPAEKVIAHWLESARRDDAARGVIWPNVDPDHYAKAGNAWHVFPNLTLGHGITFALCYRARPYGDDPNKCIFEGYVIERFPEGQEPKTEWVFAGTDEKMWGPVLIQDIQNMTQVQAGMKSRAARPMLPNPNQEQMVSNLHRNLARFMGTEGLKPLA